MMNAALRSAFRRSQKQFTIRKYDIVWAGAGLSLLAAHGYFEGKSLSTMAESVRSSNTFVERHIEEILSKYSMENYYPWILKRIRDQEGREEEEEEISQAEPTALFPTLNVELLQDGRRESFQLNSNEPIPIDNDLFVGHVLLNIRPLHPEHDPEFINRVNGEPETFRIQFQGRFKVPLKKDQLFVGSQLAGHEMVLGSFAKKLCDLILRCLASNMDADMKYSFGTPTELPHISFPLHRGMSQVVETVSGTEVPPLGKVFPTDQQETDEEYWDTENVYSFSFSANSIDLPSWKILHPWEVNLTRFWKDSPCRLVIYHQQEDDDMDYLFNLQIEHLPTTMAASQSKNDMKRDLLSNSSSF